MQEKATQPTAMTKAGRENTVYSTAAYCGTAPPLRRYNPYSTARATAVDRNQSKTFSAYRNSRNTNKLHFNLKTWQRKKMTEPGHEPEPSLLPYHGITMHDVFYNRPCVYGRIFNLR